MGITLPPELTEPLELVGMDWPQADETLLDQAGFRWFAMARSLRTSAVTANQAAARVWTRNEGPPVDGFRLSWTGNEGPQQRMAADATAAGLIGTALTTFGALVRQLKLDYLRELQQLLRALRILGMSRGSRGGRPRGRGGAAAAAIIIAYVVAARAAMRRFLRAVKRRIAEEISRLLAQARRLLRYAHTTASLRRVIRASGGLTAANRAALRDYTGDGYRDLNAYLRNTSSSQYTGDMRRELERRADGVSGALARLDPVPGTTYRGATLSDDVLARYQPGQVVNEHAFTSTSRDIRVVRGQFEGNTIMTVTGASGRDVAPFSQYPGEAEILFDRGTEFQVTSRTWDAGLNKWVITLEEVVS